MVDIIDKSLCSGCGACASVCPLQIISLVEDSEGFRYPIADSERCIDCGRCDKVCSIKNGQKVGLGNEEYYAAHLKNIDELKYVSSGGAFWAIAKAIIEKNGVVYGAVQTDINIVKHQRAETIKEAMKFRRSKYLQSIVDECYSQVNADLKMGRIVLFCGTPCQVAALKCFLENENENLLTCDIVCHGVPSTKVFNKYKEETEKKRKAKLVEIVFRDKTYGWKDNHYAETFNNGKIYKTPSVDHPFHGGYLKGLFYRPSCGQCKFASLPRLSDITLADYWKYDGELLKSSNGMGISLIIASTDKGKQWVTSCAKYLELGITCRGKAIESCKHLTNPPIENEKREQFFKILNEKGFYNAVNTVIPGQDGITKYKKRVRKILINIKYKLKSYSR